MMKDNGAAMTLMAAFALAAAAASRVGSAALVDEGMVGHRWGRQGVGVLLTTGSKILLMLRSSEVLDPGLWGIPGGAVRVDHETGDPEDLYAAASNELQEEAGLQISPRELRRMQVGETVFKDGGFRYTTFIVHVPEEFLDKRVRLNWESDESDWIEEFQLDELSEMGLLHPGVEFTVNISRDKVFHG